MPIIHELKILPEYFDPVVSRAKKFELRKDDRGFKVGDLVLLKEWDGSEYTGRQAGIFIITYILRDCEEYGLKDGYCIIGFKEEQNGLNDDHFILRSERTAASGTLKNRDRLRPDRISAEEGKGYGHPQRRRI